MRRIAEIVMKTSTPKASRKNLLTKLSTKALDIHEDFGRGEEQND